MGYFITLKKVKYSRPRNKLLGLCSRGRWIDSEGWEQFHKFTFWCVLWFYIFFWTKLTNLCFQSPNQRLFCFFLAFCGWVGKGICPSRKLVIHMVLHMFQNFIPPFIIRFVEVESCRELCSLNSGVFPPQRVWTAQIGFSSAIPGWIPLLLSRCGGWEPHSPARRCLPDLPYKRKQMGWTMMLTEL